jgi:hypothetical protein
MAAILTGWLVIVGTSLGLTWWLWGNYIVAYVFILVWALWLLSLPVAIAAMVQERRERPDEIPGVSGLALVVSLALCGIGVWMVMTAIFLR